MSAPASAKAVANTFLGFAEQEGRSLDQMQLQKLCYFAQAWWVGNLPYNLFDDDIEAWQYGPVIRTIYNEFRTFGRGPITRKATEYKVPENLTGIELSHALLNAQPIIPYVSEEGAVSYLKSVFDKYKGFSGLQLSSMTHQPDEPWTIVTSKYGVDKKEAIQPELIRAVYSAKVAQTTGG